MRAPSKPSGICACGHTGRGPNGEHRGDGGWGPCSACDCPHYRHERWVPELEAWLASPMPKQGHHLKLGED